MTEKNHMDWNIMSYPIKKLKITEIENAFGQTISNLLKEKFECKINNIEFQKEKTNINMEIVKIFTLSSDNKE